MTNKIKRRNFLETSAKGIAGAGILSAASGLSEQNSNLGKQFIHHVFFWLKKPVTQEGRTRFEKGLKALIKVETIVDYHLGIPAGTSRDVIDGTYTYSLLVTFKDGKDQEIYQTHPVHLKFIADCQDLWERVVVYDSVAF
jgi:Stress responsive A/B Barrel Domain